MMNAAVEAMPALGELNVANAFLGDRRALDDAWERDGYWYFRDVLDQEALTRLRAVYLDLLKSLGVIDRNATEAIYNGASMANYPPNMEVLVATRAWQPFVSHPAVHAFFRQVLGDEPFWIPISEYRATPPNGDRARNRFDYPHQDGFYNQGIPFRICWIPLATIDASIGGFAIAEGLHRGPCLHDLSQPPLFPIPPGAIPATAWKRAAYRAGDVVMFDIDTPHSGLANYSDKYFRLSMDIRVMGASGKVPVIGKLISVSRRNIEVGDGQGRVHRFALDEATYCRGLDGKKMSLAQIPERLVAGQELIVAHSGGRAEVIRPPH